MIKHLDELKELQLPSDQYALFGSCPLAVRNLRDNDDLDIIVTQALWNRLERQYTTSIKEYKGKKITVIRFDHIEIFKDWLPWFPDTETLIAEADIIGGLRYVCLERVLFWKESMGREKDKDDVAAIKNYLQNRLR